MDNLLFTPPSVRLIRIHFDAKSLPDPISRSITSTTKKKDDDRQATMMVRLRANVKKEHRIVHQTTTLSYLYEEQWIEGFGATVT